MGNSNKLAIEVGGYRGLGIRQFAMNGFGKMVIFEPVEEFYNECLKMASNFPSHNVQLINKALWIEEGKKECIVDNDSSSFFIDDTKNRKETVGTTTLLKYMEENEIDHIDFLQINCEGAEWALIRYILDNNLDEKIDRIRVQYHPHLKDKVPHYEDIDSQLNEFVKKGWKRNTEEFAWWNIYRCDSNDLPVVPNYLYGHNGTS